MAIPSAARNANERHNHQREGHKSKQNVRCQYRKVNCGDPPGVSRRFFADVRVVNNITRQETAEEATAVIIHAMCRRQAPCRIKYQPIEMKIVLVKFREALMAGRSEIDITLKR